MGKHSLPGFARARTPILASIVVRVGLFVGFSAAIVGAMLAVVTVENLTWAAILVGAAALWALLLVIGEHQANQLARGAVWRCTACDHRFVSQDGKVRPIGQPSCGRSTCPLEPVDA